MNIESLTIGNAFEYVESTPGVLLFEGTEIRKESSGESGEARFSVLWNDGEECVSGLAVCGSAYVGRGTVPGLGVELTAGGALQFAGNIARVRLERHGVTTYRKLIECQDFTRLLDMRVTESAIYTSQTDKQIIEDLFTTYLNTIDTTSVEEIMTIDSIDLSSLTLREAVERIAAITLADWYVDAELNLIYRDPSSSTVAFGVSEAPDDVTTFAALRDGLEFEEDFTSPANSVVAKNIAFEETQTDPFVSGTGTDDGQVLKEHTAFPPDSGSAVADTSASTMTARRQFITASPGQLQGEIAASADDGYTQKTAASFPPDAGTAFTSDSASSIFARRSFDGAFYTLGVGLLRFDTSSIPDDAEIQSVTLRIYVQGKTDTNTAQLGLEWYTWSPSMGSGQYTSTLSNSAYGYTNFSSLSFGNQELTLTGITTGINKTGYTGIRIHVKTSVTPTGVNLLTLAAYDGGSNRPRLTVNYQTGGTTYRLSVACVRFDTSALPDTCTIRSATLRLYVADKADANGASVGVEWYTGSFPIDSGEYTSTASNSAAGYTALTAVSSGGWLAFSLTSPDANISKSSYTAFRIHISLSGTPTGDNRLDFSTYEHASQDPILEITWTETPLLTGSASDTASQAVYGVFEGVVIDSRIKSAEEAALRAQAEVTQYAWPRKQGKVTFHQDGAGVAQMLYVDCPSVNFVGQFAIRSLTARWETNEITRYTAEVGERKGSLVRLLRKLNSAS